MDILDITQPKRPKEYYILLYCKRKKEFTYKNIREANRSWHSLTSEEQQIFINKFNKWQTINHKRLGSVLQCAEPFMKKKKTTIKETNNEVETITYATGEKENKENLQNIDYSISNAYSEPQDIIDNTSNAYSEQRYNDNISNVYSEPQDISDNISNVYSEPQDINDMSNAFSEPTNPVYAPSVIDTDLDETTSHQEINVVQSEPLTEPVPPTVLTAEDLFETLKSSGVRPDLAGIEWKQVQCKDIYRVALTKMKRQYLLKLEQYLESLPDRELFKYYIKTLNK